MGEGPTKLILPVAIGFGLDPGSGSSGGSRGEAITVDPGTPPRVADSRPEPKEPVAAPMEVTVPTAPAGVASEPPRAYESTGEDEIDALHARFDSMEAQIKKRLAVATLHNRFDALEAWLKARFGD